MGNIFDQDFREFIQSLNDNDVDYLLVGGYAVILHGYRRTTGDMDIWVDNTTGNYKKLTKAFYEFGLPILDMTEENFLDSSKYDVFSYGRAPVTIDIMTKMKGCNFQDAKELMQIINEDDLLIKVINLHTLRQAKKASGRHKEPR